MPIEVNQLTHIYHPGTPLETKAVDGVSMTVDRGEWVSVVGHTGSGKSTLAQHLNGLLFPDAGSVSVDGLQVQPKSRHIRQVRQKVGLVFQYPEQQLFEETVFREIAFGPRNWGVDENEIPLRVRRAMEMVGLDSDLEASSPFRLSGGQKRRVAIASVLAFRPSYLVLDEPTAGLDSFGRRDLKKLLKGLQADGLGVILITHDLELALEVSDSLLVLKNGRPIIRGEPRLV
ncbi:MAG: ATP-binding cassette domain-containing protein, partial [Synergistota bacterium]|nr:ATP-binding cassette domain-containing protein [Synergistota bacterium]